jgi:hypothetical protein
VKTLLIPTVAALLIGVGASSALAATMTGRVQHVYPQNHRIRVNNHTFTMSPRVFQSARLRTGENVHLTYHWSKDCSGNRCSSYRRATGVRAA